MRRISGVILALGAACGGAWAQGPRLVREGEYADRLRAMWLGECIANWTGLRTEGHRINPPFFTDADWGQVFLGAPLDFVLTRDPWAADDDTDVEYVYLSALDALGAESLTGPQIADAWGTHINRMIWVSNASARALIGRGVRPPSTGLCIANPQRLMIDAQLTTEIFGAMCPGMAGRALECADLPIRTTSSGYASHAAQFYAVLYALAPVAPMELSGRDRAIWLYQNARAYLPDGSKASDVADVVYADFLSNPDVNDWERTRDLVADRYQANAAAQGFKYRAWYESSVNFACGVMALLYGQCDYRRTVQIGTLSGWDSDNATATLGGMIGLMIGYEALVAQFPGVTFSDRYTINVTRDAMPDHLPLDPGAEDTFTLMAARMIPIVRREILAGGGLVDEGGGVWLLPPAIAGDPVLVNPLGRLDGRSVNNTERRGGRPPAASSSVPPGNTQGRGINQPAYFANGLETEYSGAEELFDTTFFSTQGGVSGGSVALTVTYAQPVPVASILFVEGDHYNDAVSQGGWFTTLVPQVFVGGVWQSPAVVQSEALDAGRPFQMIRFDLATPVLASAIRVQGVPGGGGGGFVTCGELDALMPGAAPVAATFDLDGDGGVSLDDLYAWSRLPVDLNGDGIAGVADQSYLARAARWGERSDLLNERP